MADMDDVDMYDVSCTGAIALSLALFLFLIMRSTQKG